MASWIPPNDGSSHYDWVYDYGVGDLPQEVRQELQLLLDETNTLDSPFRQLAEGLGYNRLETNHFLRMIEVGSFHHSPTNALLDDYEKRKGATIRALQAVLETMNHRAAEVIPSYLPRIAQQILTRGMHLHPQSTPQPPQQQPPREHYESSHCSGRHNSMCCPQPCPAYRSQESTLYANPAPSLGSIGPQSLSHSHNSSCYRNGTPNHQATPVPSTENPQHTQHPMPSCTPFTYAPCSPLEPKRQMSGELSDCSECRLESDPEQTKVMTTVGQPDSKCDSHRHRLNPLHYNNVFSEGSLDQDTNDNGRESIECLSHFTDSVSDGNSVSETGMNVSHAQNNPDVQHSSPEQLNHIDSEGESEDDDNGDDNDESRKKHYVVNWCRRSLVPFQHLRKSWPEEKKMKLPPQNLLSLQGSNSSPSELNDRQIQSLLSNQPEPGQFSNAITLYKKNSRQSSGVNMDPRPYFVESDHLSHNFENNLGLSNKAAGEGVLSHDDPQMRQNIEEPYSRSTNCSSDNWFKSFHGEKKSNSQTNMTTSSVSVDRTGENISVQDNAEPSSSMATGGDGADSGSVPILIPGGIRKPIVLVTFSHNRADGSDHPREVTELCFQLKRSGVIVRVDMDGQSFRELCMNAQDWLDRWFERAHLVIACITPTYSADVQDVDENQANPRTSQLNARYIYTKIRHEFYANQSRNKRCIPVLFSNSGATQDHIPDWMTNTLTYRYPDGVEEIMKAIIATLEPDQDGVIHEYHDPYNEN